MGFILKVSKSYEMEITTYKMENQSNYSIICSPYAYSLESTKYGNIILFLLLKNQKNSEHEESINWASPKTV